MVYLCSGDISVITRWENALGEKKSVVIESLDEINDHMDEPGVLFLDMDSSPAELKRLYSGEYRAILEDIKIMAFEKVPDPQTGKRLLLIGVKAYANTWIMPLHLLSALDTVENGGIWLYPEFVHALVNEIKPKSGPETEEPALFGKLTHREKELAGLILSGMNNAQIAAHLSISERTVKAHVTNIFKKAHVSDRLSFVLLMKE